MVVGWLLGLLRRDDGDSRMIEGGGGVVLQKPPVGKETKKDDVYEFIKSDEAKRLIAQWRKEYKIRGMSKLLRLAWLSTKSRQEALKEAKETLAALKGKDGLEAFLAGLKIASEKIIKIS